MRLILLVLALAFGAPALANDLLPIVPTAIGDPHPEGNDFMRRNHMDMMKHGRDLTLREGERDIDASLGQCFDCHAVVEDGAPVTYDNEKHFCRTCHDYAAVKVDCFMCHRSTPAEDDLNRAMAKPEDADSIAAYLARVAEESQ
ncbi:hypothetical protein [Aliiroseovarius subalbicans]|uniref:hypothetical protein n=1 Tax=Aliiroseovarius subalbicans TaxID=2925840 RepID=UPI001F57D654|nr:hypothetical protein [Aliiroseovarius subalbicans]MCI2400135.1 hypothetical protein [Aliiroseovarius subalbicans]